MGRAGLQSKSTGMDLLIVTVAALAVRMVYLFSIQGEPLFDFPQVDARVYWDEAIRIAGGGSGPAGDAASAGVYYTPPLFKWVLAALVKLFGGDAGAARWALALLSSLTAPAVCALARPILGRGGSLAAGMLVAFYAPAVFYGAELLSASTVLLLNGTMLVLLLCAEERGRGGGAALFLTGGLLLGLSAITRPTILLFALLLLIRYGRMPRRAGMLLAGIAIAIVPVTIQNMMAGDFVLVSSNGGLNFYMGNHEGTDGRSARAPELPNEPGEARRAAERIAAAESGRSLKPSEVSFYWFRKGINWIAGDPAGWAALTCKRTIYLLNDREISDNIDFHTLREVSLPLKLTPLRFGLLLALGAVGLRRVLRTREGRLLALYGMAVALPPILFFVVGRFRLPLLPFLAVAGAAGAIDIVQTIRRWNSVSWKERASPILLFFIVLNLSLLPWFGINRDMSWHYHYLCGDTFYRKGDPDRAVLSFEESFTRNPDVPLTRNALGFLYAELGRNLDRAEELIRGAIAREPGRRRFYLDSLGWVLFKQGRLDHAAEAFEEAIPLFAPEERGSREEAERHLGQVRRAIEQSQDRPR